LIQHNFCPPPEPSAFIKGIEPWDTPSRFPFTGSLAGICESHRGNPEPRFRVSGGRFPMSGRDFPILGNDFWWRYFENSASFLRFPTSGNDFRRLGNDFQKRKNGQKDAKTRFF